MFVRPNTILIPDEDELQRILGLATEASQLGKHIFQVDNQKFFAHITIYSPEYPKESYDKIVEAVSDIARNTRRVDLVFDDFYTAWGYLVLGFKDSDQVKKLHQTVVFKLNPLREGRIREKYAAEIQNGKYSDREIGYINDFGYHLVLMNYHPHLTLARFESEAVALNVKERLLKFSIPSKFSFPVLAISETGENGTCTRIIEKFSLKTKNGVLGVEP